MKNEIQSNFESIEKERIVPHVLIFDVDGVLTHPSEKRVTKTEILAQLSKKLENDEPIILNTGRAADFMINNILIPLEKLVKDKNTLRNIFAVGEKGAINIFYNNGGQRVIQIDKSISVPEPLQDEAKNIVEKKFSDIAFYDSTKKTMITVEMLDKLPVEKFTERQAELNKELTDLLSRHNLLSEYKVDPTRIATDVENKHVGKGLGVKKALTWLKEQNIESQQFIAFGDSKSDIEMAEELDKQNLPVEFVFVGDKEEIDSKNLKFPVTYTNGHCESGTAEYLKNLEN